jgi:hypothetical protein
MANDALIKSRIALAQEMIEKLDNQAQFTSSNRGMALLTDKLGFTDHVSKTTAVYQNWPASNYGDNDPSPIVLANTLSLAHGNCDMKAEAVYSMVYNMPQQTGTLGAHTKILTCQVPGHTFCILCSQGITTVEGNQYGLDHFGEEAVVCDGWQSDYYAPNVWWPYGRTPGVEALVVRKKIAYNQVTVVKVHSFYLP